MKSKPLVLCVDDDNNILESMQLNLRKEFKVLTAPSGMLGLEMLVEHSEIAVVLSDMRMPEMDGAAFLAEVRSRFPDVVRMLLTGYSDIDAAMRAVNEGQIFRFLSKPCAPDHLKTTMGAAVEQHRLLTAERVLLQKTLLGSVKAMIETLALANPMSLGRAVRTKDLIRRCLAATAIEPHWPIEFAALLSQLSVVALADSTIQKIHEGEDLDDTEVQRVMSSMKAVTEILSNIPRLEPVTAILKDLRRLLRDSRASAGEEARLLFAVLEVDKAESRGLPRREAIDSVASAGHELGDTVAAALDALIGTVGDRVRRSVAACDLETGMVLVDDLCNHDGIVILPRGFEVAQCTLEHIKNHLEELADVCVDVLVETGQVNEPQENLLCAS